MLFSYLFRKNICALFLNTICDYCSSLSVVLLQFSKIFLLCCLPGFPVTLRYVKTSHHGCGFLSLSLLSLHFCFIDFFKVALLDATQAAVS